MLTNNENFPVWVRPRPPNGFPARKLNPGKSLKYLPPGTYDVYKDEGCHNLLGTLIVAYPETGYQWPPNPPKDDQKQRIPVTFGADARDVAFEVDAGEASAEDDQDAVVHFVSALTVLPDA